MHNANLVWLGVLTVMVGCGGASIAPQVASVSEAPHDDSSAQASTCTDADVREALSALDEIRSLRYEVGPGVYEDLHDWSAHDLLCLGPSVAVLGVRDAFVRKAGAWTRVTLPLHTPALSDGRTAVFCGVENDVAGVYSLDANAVRRVGPALPTRAQCRSAATAGDRVYVRLAEGLLVSERGEAWQELSLPLRSEEAEDTLAMTPGAAWAIDSACKLYTLSESGEPALARDFGWEGTCTVHAVTSGSHAERLLVSNVEQEAPREHFTFFENGSVEEVAALPPSPAATDAVRARVASFVAHYARVAGVDPLMVERLRFSPENSEEAGAQSSVVFVTPYVERWDGRAWSELSSASAAHLLLMAGEGRPRIVSDEVRWLRSLGSLRVELRADTAMRGFGSILGSARDGSEALITALAPVVDGAPQSPPQNDALGVALDEDRRLGYRDEHGWHALSIAAGESVESIWRSANDTYVVAAQNEEGARVVYHFVNNELRPMPMSAEEFFHEGAREWVPYREGFLVRGPLSLERGRLVFYFHGGVVERATLPRVDGMFPSIAALPPRDVVFVGEGNTSLVLRENTVYAAHAPASISQQGPLMFQPLVQNGAVTSWQTGVAASAMFGLRTYLTDPPELREIGTITFVPHAVEQSAPRSRTGRRAGRRVR